MTDDSAYLHLYGQEQWHGDAYIIGNTAGLKALRDAIDRALANEKGADSLSAFVNDGEGYYTGVVKIDKPEDFDRLAVPYNDEIAQDHRDDAIWPWQIKRAIDAVQSQYDQLREQNSPEQIEEIKLSDEEAKTAINIFAPEEDRHDI